MPPLAALPHRQRVRRQAIFADLASPFISRVRPFRLTPITRIRRQSPTAAEPPPRPAPSMARIARSLPKRAAAGCLSRTAGNLSRIPGRSQHERHSCRQELQPGVSCHQPTPQALRRIERRAQSAALARIDWLQSACRRSARPSVDNSAGITRETTPARRRRLPSPASSPGRDSAGTCIWSQLGYFTAW